VFLWLIRRKLGFCLLGSLLYRSSLCYCRLHQAYHDISRFSMRYYLEGSGITIRNKLYPQDTKGHVRSTREEIFSTFRLQRGNEFHGLRTCALEVLKRRKHNVSVNINVGLGAEGFLVNGSSFEVS